MLRLLLILIDCWRCWQRTPWQPLPLRCALTAVCRGQGLGTAALSHPPPPLSLL